MYENGYKCVEECLVIDPKTIERAVMADQQRPCLYHIAPPCFHPKCLEAHYETLRQRATKREEKASDPR